jgi:hypothetical protein
MSAIELRPSKKAKGGWTLLIGGQSFGLTQFQVSGVKTKKYQLMVHGKGAAEAIKKQAFQELPDRFSSVVFEYQFEWIPVHSVIVSQPNPGKFEISHRFIKAWAQWKRPWTIGEYLEALMETISAEKEGHEEWSVRTIKKTGKQQVFFNVFDPTISINQGLTRANKLLRKFHDKAVVELLSRHEQRALVLSFEFPPQVKVPCEQYLLYFVQFLSDLGIEATADIQHEEAGNLLFSIKPNDKDEALENIRRALEIYLQLSESKDTSSIDNQHDPRVQSLIAEIHSLHGKLALRAAELQYKDATIGLLQQTSELQRKLLTGQVMLDSLKYVGMHKEVKDKQEFLDGMFTLTELEGKGYKVNLPKIYRMLKEYLITDSDKED